MFVIGLDWVNRRSGWAYCKLETGDGRDVVEIGTIGMDAIHASPLLVEANRIVLDAPIGLPSVGETGCACRRCDLGAKRWIGSSLQSSVFAVPYKAELAEWRRREQNHEVQRQGHFRGLLPAIHSAAVIVENFPDKTLESHPEVVFAALAGKPLPSSAKKTTLPGMLVRLGLLTRYGLTRNVDKLVKLPPIASDNFVDAMAMAVVAKSWCINADVWVVRNEEGRREQLSVDPNERCLLMALPCTENDSREKDLLTVPELLQIVKIWLVQNTQGEEDNDATT